MNGSQHVPSEHQASNCVAKDAQTAHAEMFDEDEDGESFGLDDLLPVSSGDMIS